MLCNLTLIGKWQSNELKKKVKTLLLNNKDSKKIIFKKYIPNNMLPMEYQKADLVVLNLQWDEPCPKTLYESLACGTPVLVTDKAAVAKELINNNISGIIVPVNRFESTLCNLVYKPEIIRKMKYKEINKISEEYSFESVYKKLKVFFNISNKREKKNENY